MSLYARSDLMSVSVPTTSGGCGDSHSRPVVKGSPAKTWELNCPQCEAYLKGSRKPQVLKTTPGDPKLGIPAKQERVADCDPHWSSTPESVPLTPDEQSTNATRTERASHQIQMIQALAALRAAGTDIPFETAWMMERELPSAFIKGNVVCPNGHDNMAGAKFCSECAVAMNGQREIEAPADDDPEDLSDYDLLRKYPDAMKTMHVATLKQLCRQQGLSDKGTKAALIERLKSLQGTAA